MAVNPLPEVFLIEQPSEEDYRLRYESELNGSNNRSVPIMKGPRKGSFPKIKVANFTGRADIIISAVTSEEKQKNKGNYMPHPMKVVSKKDIESHQRGYTYIQTSIDSTGSVELKFGLVAVSSKSAAHWLQIRDEHHVDPFNTGFESSKNLNASNIRICIQVFIYKSDGTPVKLEPVVTKPLCLKKKEKLFIKYMVPSEGSVDGGTEVTILCGKIHKDDILVEFFHESGWKAVAELSEPGVYKQMSITFKSPPFFDPGLQTPEVVQVRLRRPSDNETSNSKDFCIKPDNKRKRQEWTSNLSTIHQLLSHNKKAKFSEPQDLDHTSENWVNVSSSNSKSTPKRKDLIEDCSYDSQLDPNILDMYEYLFCQNPQVSRQLDDLVPDIVSDQLHDDLLDKELLELASQAQNKI